LKTQIRASKKVIALRKQLLKASNPKVKAAIKAQLKKAKVALKQAKTAVKAITKKVDGAFSKKTY